MDNCKLSLSPSLSTITNVEMKRTWAARTETNSRKRKHNFVELPVRDPLPSDWEKCLDLQSRRMYYLNRRILTKMWNRPYKEQKLDLELSIMPAISDKSIEKTDEKQVYLDDNSMIAIVCINCHLPITEPLKMDVFVREVGRLQCALDDSLCRNLLLRSLDETNGD